MVLERVLSRSMTVAQAARVLALSERQVKRLKAGVMNDGVAFLAHKNRGRKPKHAIPEVLRRRIVELATTTYRGANYSHLTELLAEHEDICLSVSSVTRILRTAGVKSPRKRRSPRLHPSRQRRARFGELVLADASPYAWLEERGPVFSLHGLIDDATGIVLGAIFRPHEDLQGYFEVVRQMAASYGLPLALYTDRHTIFVAAHRQELTIEEELAGRQLPVSQFARALQQLGITHLRARSPQAKGRIERLWQTFQDRLAVELRLAGASTIDQANQILATLVERHNQRFSVQPQNPDSAFRLGPEPQVLNEILCRHEQRTVSNGVTFSYLGNTYQILDGNEVALINPRSKVTVHEHANGLLTVDYQGILYSTRPLPLSSPAKQPVAEQTSPVPQKERAGVAKPRKPAQDHPWKRWPAVRKRRPNAPSNHIIPPPINQEVTFSQHTLE